MKMSPRCHSATKIVRVLSYLLYEGSLNRFEAERIGDHCINSTISTLANGHGVRFKRQPERVPNRWGEPCDVIRYSITDEVRAEAELVLTKLQGRVRLAPQRQGARYG